MSVTTCPVLASYQRRLSSSVKSELNHEIAGEVLRLNFPAFLPPQPDQRLFVIAHNDRASEPPIK